MTQPERGKNATFRWKGPGRTAFLDISQRTGEGAAATRKSFGLDGPTLNDGGQPITWPDGDMIRKMNASHADLSWSFTVNNDGVAGDAGSFGHFFRSGGKEAEFEYGPPGAMSGQSGQPKYSGKVSVDSCNMTNPPRGQSTFQVTAGIDSWEEGTFS